MTTEPSAKRTKFMAPNPLETIGANCLKRVASFIHVKDLVSLRSTSSYFLRARNLFGVVAIDPPRGRTSYWDSLETMKVLGRLCQDAEILRPLLQNKELAKHWHGGNYDDLMKEVIFSNSGASVRLLLEDGKAEVEGLFEYAKRKEVELGRELPQAVAVLQSNAKVMETVQNCEVCQERIGIFECQRDDECRNEDHKVAKRCFACRGAGSFCGVCKQFQCRACDGSQEQGEEWHPECKLDLFLERCSICREQACRLFNARCYIECAICDRVECKQCRRPNWMGCASCQEEMAAHSDAYTNTGIPCFCPSCVSRPCPKCVGTQRVDELSDDEW